MTVALLALGTGGAGFAGSVVTTEAVIEGTLDAGEVVAGPPVRPSTAPAAAARMTAEAPAMRATFLRGAGFGTGVCTASDVVREGSEATPTARVNAVAISVALR